MQKMDRRNFLKTAGIAGIAGIAGAMGASNLAFAADGSAAKSGSAASGSVSGSTSASGSASASASASAAGSASAVAGSTMSYEKVDPALVMPEDLGKQWAEYKATCGPLYPGYDHFDEYLTFIKDQLTDMGCVDYTEHRWDFESYRVNDWPDHDSGALKLSIDGEDLPVGAFLHLSAATPAEGLTADMVFYDVTANIVDGSLGSVDDGYGPEEGEWDGKIVVMKAISMPEPPYTDSFLDSYVVTDTNYRSDPEPPAPMFQRVDPTVNNSWNTRWDFGQWGTMNKYAEAGGAAGLIILSNLTWGCLEGLYERQSFRASHPALVVDRVTAETVEEAAKAGSQATMTELSEFFDTEDWNFLYFLPGKDYGTDDDDYITINTHSDAMSLTQDDGALGALGVCYYFSQIPQEQRLKTLVFCIDTRHFIEGFESGTFEHDPYQVYPEVAKKVSVTVGMEHMGELEGAEDYDNNTMVCTGNPEFSFMKADDNDWCARVLIQAAIDSGLERADIKVDGRPGNHGEYKGVVRAVQASTHKLGVCVIGEAGNWCGAHTQIFSGMDYFGTKKFHDEVYTWSQVVLNFMGVDSIVYDIVWSKINNAIRVLGKAELIDAVCMEGLLNNVRDIFANVEAGDYALAAGRLQKDVIETITALAPADYDYEQDLIKVSASGLASMSGSSSVAEGQEYLNAYKQVQKAIKKLGDKAGA